MTPSTPPRSRSTMEDQQPVTDDFFLSNMPRKQQMPPATPQKNTGSEIPMTPSTIMHRGNNNISGNDQQGKLFKAGQPQLLAPPQLQKFSGLKSPEFSPMRRLSIPNNSLPKTFNTGKKNNINNKSNDNVSRVLFPMGLDSDDDDDVKLVEEEDEDEDRLLPPSTPPPSKSAKIIPATPSHKIITSQQAKQWNNQSHSLSLSSDEEEESNSFITKKTIENPFMTASTSITKEERLQRHQKLIDENPDIENVITYVNKRGEPVKQRTLTPRQKDRFKPKALFQDQE